MAKEGLEIDITVKADNAAKEIRKITDALGGIDDKSGVIEQLDARIKKLGADLKTAKTPEQLAKINAELERTKVGLNSIKTGNFTSGLNGATKSIQGTNTALVNFGRVIQDAPFGIIGIANNIDPLISSFQNLKKETGSTGGALKALASGLAGPAGIAIAVSAVTSVLVAFGPQIAEFLGFTKDSGEAAKAAAKGFNDAATSVANEAAQVEKLVAVINSETTSRRQKESALSDLNRISSVYFDGLKVENGIVQGLEPAYKAYVASLLNVARAKAAQTKISELYTKRLELESKIVGTTLTSALNKVASANDKINKSFKSQKEVGLIGPGLTKDENAALGANIQITELDKQIAKLAASTIPAFDNQSKTAKATTDKLTESVEKQRKALDELYAPQGPSQKTTILIGREELAQQNFLIRTVLSGIGEIPPATAEAGASLLSIVAKQQESLQKIKEATEQQLAEDSLAAKAQNAVTAFNLLTPAVDQAFNAIANGENAFEAVQQALKRLLIDLAKAAALSLILSAITGGAAGAGFNGAKGFLGIFKGLLGFKASGGGVDSNSSYLVGENGPELFIPGANGAIVNNNALRGAGGGSLMARVSGNDLLFILNKAGNNRSVNFG